jgi:hypothetical protein
MAKPLKVVESNDLAIDDELREAQGLGVEYVTKDDVVIPSRVILPSLSPQLSKKSRSGLKAMRPEISVILQQESHTKNT